MMCKNNCHAKEAQAELVYSQESITERKKKTNKRKHPDFLCYAFHCIV